MNQGSLLLSYWHKLVWCSMHHKEEDLRPY